MPRMSGGSASGFSGELDQVLLSGDEKHVMAGIAIIFCSPWCLMNRGSKHQSHQDYMEKADKAQRAKLSAK